MGSVLADLRFALRSYRRTPLVAATVVVTLALGIGTVGAIFSVVNAVVLQPLPYQDADELVLVTSQFPTMGFDRFWLSPPEYLELEEWNDSFEAIAGYRAGDVSIVGTEQPIRVRALSSTASLFEVLGVQPLRGRFFSEEEDAPGGEEVVILSERLWREAFHGREDILGTRLELDGDAGTVIGVMPAGFDIEESGAQVFLPAGLDRSDYSARGSHWMNVVARLKDDRTFEQASSEIDALVANWKERSGARHAPSADGHPFRVLSLHEEVIGDTRPALMALLGAVGFVLLIACVNVANLMLSRSESRQREVAMRTILGASKARIVQQVLTETIALAILSGALGLALAHWGLQAILRANPEALPRAQEIGLDWRVTVFAAAVAIGTGILFGLAPALRMGSKRFGESLREGGQRTTQSLLSKRVRQGLVAVELALAVALVIGAGLMIKSLGTLLDVDPGFDADKLTAFELYLPDSTYPTGNDQAAFLKRLTGRIETFSGVSAVTITSDLPPQRTLNANDTSFEGLERTEDGPPHNTDYWEFITASYFDTMGARILDGRPFDESDSATSPPVVLINQKLAETFWPGQNAVGKRLRPGWGELPWFTVVGIVDNVKQDGLDQASGTHVYWHYEQAAAVDNSPSRMYVLVRSEEAAETLRPRLREAVWSMDPTLAVSNIQAMEQAVVASASRPQFLALLLGLFAGAALFLAAIGIYGVLSYSVSQSGHEIGIRMALGADRSMVMAQVLRQGLVVIVLGLGLGIGIALSISRWIRALLFGVAPNDPVTYVWVLALLALVALAACVIPALRATRVSPLSALHHD